MVPSSPAASHVRADAQAMLRRLASDVRGPAAQVLPPSDVRSRAVPCASAPTARHVVVDGHAMAVGSSLPGTLAVRQVVPPSAVRTISPAPVADLPTATHRVLDAQAIPARRRTWRGTACLRQVAPPSVVPSARPSSRVDPASRANPTTSQAVTEPHAVAARKFFPPGMLCVVHLDPPSVVLSTEPVPIAVMPDASHVLRDGQAMENRAYGGAGYALVIVQACVLAPA